LARLKNDLVATVSHELKTPLTAMRALVDTLLDTGRFDEKTTREYLKLLATENARLSRLIDNFLTFSRLERNNSRSNSLASSRNRSWRVHWRHWESEPRHPVAHWNHTSRRIFP